jgi:hypothetical protein
LENSIRRDNVSVILQGRISCAPAVVNSWVTATLVIWKGGSSGLRSDHEIGVLSDSYENIWKLEAVMSHLTKNNVRNKKAGPISETSFKF